MGEDRIALEILSDYLEKSVDPLTPSGSGLNFKEDPHSA